MRRVLDAELNINIVKKIREFFINKIEKPGFFRIKNYQIEDLIKACETIEDVKTIDDLYKLYLSIDYDANRSRQYNCIDQYKFCLIVYHIILNY